MSFLELTCAGKTSLYPCLYHLPASKQELGVICPSAHHITSGRTSRPVSSTEYAHGHQTGPLLPALHHWTVCGRDSQPAVWEQRPARPLCEAGAQGVECAGLGSQWWTRHGLLVLKPLGDAKNEQTKKVWAPARAPLTAKVQETCHVPDKCLAWGFHRDTALFLSPQVQ